MERMQIQQQQYLNSFPGTPREIYLVTIFSKLLFIYLFINYYYYFIIYFLPKWSAFQVLHS